MLDVESDFFKSIEKFEDSVESLQEILLEDACEARIVHSQTCESLKICNYFVLQSL